MKIQAQGSSQSRDISGLPIHFDSTSYLIHPIVKYSDAPKKNGLYKKSRSSKTSDYVQVYRSGYKVSGDLINLKFQHLDSNELIPLTEEPLRIKSFQFLHSLFETSKKQLLLYIIKESITSNDEEGKAKEVETLYLSEINGKSFQRLTPDKQGLLDWKFIPIKNHLYFTTWIDQNKDEVLNDTDRIHYYYVDLLEDEKVVVEYHPTEFD